MEQLSLPYRIGLAGILVFALAWFAVLRPKSATDDGGGAPLPAPTPAAAASSAGAAPGTKGLQTAIDKAKGAVATANGAAATEAATGQATAVTTNAAATPAATTAAATPATATSVGRPAATAPDADPSRVILADVAAGKTAVVLFSSRQGADDRHVRSSLHRLDRHRGKVAIRSASIDDVAKYSAITKGVSIVQAPTLLVIGKDLKARAIVGYTDTPEIQQLVNDIGGFHKPSR